MRGSAIEVMRALLVAPYREKLGREAIGDALWLYAWLVAIVNTSGHVCRARASLAKDVGATDAEIETWLRGLQRRGPAWQRSALQNALGATPDHRHGLGDPADAVAFRERLQGAGSASASRRHHECRDRESPRSA